MGNYREIYEKEHRIIPKGYEIHHKIPKRIGGTDDIKNLIALTRKEHSLAHLKLYEDYGEIRDLCAYYMLSGNFDRSSASRIAGLIGGAKTVKEKLGFHGASHEQRAIWNSAAGKIGGKVQTENGLGFHQYNKNPELHRSWCSKGGKVGAFSIKYYLNKGYDEKEAKNMLKEQQSKRGRRGGVKNSGSVWINDGIKTKKYTTKDQDILPIEDFLRNNPCYKLGRIKN